MTVGLLRQTATISRASRASDGQGGWVASFAVIASGVKCKLDASSAREDEAGEQERAKTPRKLYVEGDVDIQRDDRVEVSTGEVVTILAVRRPGGQPFVLGEHLECDAEEVTHGV